VTGTELRTARTTLGLTQAKLAKQLGVHVLTVSGWELGRHKIPGPVTLAVKLLAGV